MLVNRLIRECPACLNTKATSEIIDVALEDIRLNDTPIACKCGYFRTFKDYTLNFDNWREAKRNISYDLKWANERVESIRSSLNEVDPASKEFEWHKKWLQEEIDKLNAIIEKDKAIGETPIPNVLYMIK